MNLLSLAEQLSGNEEAAVQFDARRCLHHGDKLSGCDACYEVCPEGAIEPGRPPTVEGEACRFCRACLPVCPTGAYAMEDEAPDLMHCAARLEQSAPERYGFEIICQHHPRPQYGPDAAAIRIRGCLAGLGAAAYVQLSTLSADHITIRTDACEGCPWSQLAEQIEQQLEEANGFLQPWFQRPALNRYAVADEDEHRRRPAYSAHSPPVSRRSLFRFGAEPEPEREALADGFHPFRERMRLLSALPALPAYEREAAAETVMPGPGYATLTVSEACSACGTCARACPSGALELCLDEDAQRFALDFSLQACLACGASVDLCPEEAIELHPAPTV
ncbi:MAG TPA: 4Fe-4S dicluster domain-containing protein, partial [Candidatus Sulfomarinibacteraceae bacterium]|nr:4Fe-4S dicluster domain-containing protein [Candidatus Sulfomarinibacteraceae bacterium]